MASVRVDKPNDPRFKLLGSIIGTNQFDAKGRMIDVWAYCTEKHTYILKEIMINAIAENPAFADAMVVSDLGERVEGGVRVKGTAGRIEWLAKKRENGKKGGRPPEEREENLNETETEPNDNLEVTESKPNDNPLTITIAPSITLSTSSTKSNKTPKNIDFDFESLYEIFPKRLDNKNGRKPGLKKCRKWIKTQEIFEKFSVAVKNYTKNTFGDLPPETRFEYSTNWNNWFEEWEDWVEPPPPQTKSPPKSFAQKNEENLQNMWDRVESGDL